MAALRQLPSVDVLVSVLVRHAALAGIPRRRVAETVREVLAEERRRVL
ncbi:MAG: hypothetical protein ABW020_09950, partial [Candidatus Rokuibacteriota bacterium]